MECQLCQSSVKLCRCLGRDGRGGQVEMVRCGVLCLLYSIFGSCGERAEADQTAGRQVQNSPETHEVYVTVWCNSGGRTGHKMKDILSAFALAHIFGWKVASHPSWLANAPGGAPLSSLPFQGAHANHTGDLFGVTRGRCVPASSPHRSSAPRVIREWSRSFDAPRHISRNRQCAPNLNA